MLHTKSKRITLPLCLCIISVLFTPAIMAATSTGDIAALRAAEQKAALAKKAAEKQAKKAAAEANKATETQQAPVQAPVEEKRDATEAQTPAQEQK